MTLVVLGLDGFHHNLLHHTPYINELFEDNASNTLQSTTPPMTAPAWASFQTGVNQGKHGVFDFVEYTDNNEITIQNGEALRAKPIYEWIDDAGYDCYIQNLPFALPPRIQGDIMPSWLDGGETTPFPADLDERYGVNRPNYPALNGTPLEDIDEMERCFSTNSSIFESILTAHDHDFYFQLISVTDWLQHMAYEDLVRNPDSSVANAAQSLLKHVDSYVKRITEILPEEANIILLSDHGFEIYTGSFYVNDWLDKNGYLERSRDGHRFATKSERDTTVLESGSFGYWVRKRAFWPLLRPAKNLLERWTDIKFTPEMGIDLDNSLAYCRSKDEKAIHCNHQLPMVDTELIEEIKTELNETPYVSAELGRQLYAGPYAEEGGDIILTEESHFVNRGPVGDIIVNNTIAHHNHDGLLICRGPAFCNPPKSPALIDVAPTILHMFDISVPKALDGQILGDALNVKSPLTYTEMPEYQPRFYSQGAKEEEVEERLNNLGYL